MKIIKLFIIVLSIVSLCGACTVRTHTNLNTPQIKEFKKDMKAQYSQISSIEFKFTVPALKMNYSFKSEISEEDKQEIFNKTREFFLQEDFQKEFFRIFFKKYYNDEGQTKKYPTAYINFDTNNDKVAEYQFYSRYYTQPYNSGGKNEIDGYKTWRYSNFKGEVYTVPDKQ